MSSRNVPAITLVTLADLRYPTSYDSNYLDEQQRKVLLMPVLADSDGDKGGEKNSGVSPGGGRVERSR